MLSELKQREKNNEPINIGVVGAGSMGLAIAYQIGITPGMGLSFIADKCKEKAEKAAEIYGKPALVTTDALAALEDHKIPCDVLVEATNTIVAAYDYCMAAIRRRAHCILMNAEVDLVLGHLLRREAQKESVLVTSDAGDQHGVLSRMIEEIQLWGFDITQAGNMKRFLDRYRTMEGSIEIAKSLKLSTQQCLAYTDGTKLNIEMSIIANQYSLKPYVTGMEGPRAEKVEDVLKLFNFDLYGNQGRVDYILGARQHGGGVYVIGKSESHFQKGYLNYYKVANIHPYYLFFRPYHLCHLETTRAIALAVLYGKSVCGMDGGNITNCYAYSKRKLKKGEEIKHAIGSDEVYGLIESTSNAGMKDLVPIGLLDAEESPCKPTLLKDLSKDEPLTLDSVNLPQSRLVDLWEKQQRVCFGTWIKVK